MYSRIVCQNTLSRIVTNLYICEVYIYEVNNNRVIKRFLEFQTISRNIKTFTYSYIIKLVGVLLEIRRLVSKNNSSYPTKILQEPRTRENTEIDMFTYFGQKWSTISNPK